VIGGEYHVPEKCRKMIWVLALLLEAGNGGSGLDREAGVLERCGGGSG